jgi:hypothetical protein
MPNLQVILIGTLGILLVTTTTAFVGREWHIPQAEPARRLRQPEQAGLTDDGEEKEEDVDENTQENLNVLHLLYTIAQVPSNSILPVN